LNYFLATNKHARWELIGKLRGVTPAQAEKECGKWSDGAKTDAKALGKIRERVRDAMRSQLEQARKRRPPNGQP